jgi:hypothetical protein
MPRKPRSATPLSLSEFDKLTSTFTELFTRLRFTLSSNAEAQEIVDRLTRAGFLPGTTSRPGRPAKAAPSASPATAKGRRRGRRRQRIDNEKIVAAVKKGGGAGQTSGQIADTLGVPVDRLRFQLYTMRDSGVLKMIGDKSTAKYVVQGGAPAAAAAKPASTSPAPKKARKKRKKAHKATAKATAKASPKATKKAATKKTANGVSKKKASAKAAAAAKPAASPAAA